MELSYWEYKSWLSNIDFTIIGSGIVGLSTALHLKKRLPTAKILILEKGVLPQGASTKNAGFACFGSISEVLSDLENHSEAEITTLVAQRFKGIQLLRETLGDANIGFQELGGHELFIQKEATLFEKCNAALDRINQMLAPVFGEAVFTRKANTFGFQGIHPQMITHTKEGQLDTGKMMKHLLLKVQKAGVVVLNSVAVEEFSEETNKVLVKTNAFEMETKRLVVTTNGFATKLIQEDVVPARAQVLITKPIDGLNIKGTFHLEEGYYYFRNIDNRILLGGGRNLDFNAEKTMDFGQTPLVQNELERLLKEVILPNQTFEIDRRWSGIMGVGPQKRPIIRQVSDHVYCGLRLGGMGIAIGSSVGKQLADLV